MFKEEALDRPVETPVLLLDFIELSPIGKLLLEASLANMERHGTDPPPEG